MSIITKTLQSIADKYSVTLIIGNYPHCSYTFKGAYTASGEWWDLDVNKDTILIPCLELASNRLNFSVDNYVKIVLGFYHELGHILNHRESKQFKTKFKDQLTYECSAWVTGLGLFFKSEFSYFISKEDVHRRVGYCLSTYM